MARGPVDPRLLRHAASARRFFVLGAFVGVLQAAATVLVAWSIAEAVVGPERGLPLLLLAVGVLARAGSGKLLDSLAARGAARVKSELRMRVLAAISAAGPGGMTGRNSARVTTIVASGLDALDGYFARFLPQLVLTAVAVPITVLVLFTQDLETGLIVIATLPVIPLFMVLVGWATRAVQKQQWNAMTTLAAGFLEVVQGLATLTIFGRQHRQEARIAAVTEGYRARTMAVLRMSFVSGFVLELAASLSVAVVAVTIGVRLVDGSLPLSIGLFVLVLVPEVYLPIRAVGAQFHASADGVAAADDVFELIDAPTSVVTHRAKAGELVIEDLTVRYGDRVVVDLFSARFAPGSLTAIVAPSGAGKSTIVAAMLGFVPFTGSISLGRESIAWAGQSPSLGAGTVAENITMGHCDEGAADAAVLAEAMRLACVETGLAPLGADGAGLSGGQAQRVAIARALYRALHLGCPIIVLDEPTSALDGATEASVLAGLRELADHGYTVVVVSHRSAVVSFADAVVSPAGVASGEAASAVAPSPAPTTAGVLA